MSLTKRVPGRCSAVLTEGPRVGEVCNRRFFSPNTACERHRPKEVRVQVRDGTYDERHREAERRRAKKRRGCGIPVGWVI